MIYDQASHSYATVWRRHTGYDVRKLCTMCSIHHRFTPCGYILLNGFDLLLECQGYFERGSALIFSDSSISVSAFKAEADGSDCNSTNVRRNKRRTSTCKAVHQAQIVCKRTISTYTR